MLREPDQEPIAGYRLVGPLGTGGFGEVWKCIAPGGIDKAIKFVYGNLNSLEGDAIRAEQEQRALQRVKEVRHPFVVQMDRIEVVQGELVIVMELADKSLHDSLHEYQSQGFPGIPRDILLRYLHDAAEGLDYLIERYNLQHLDVKPRNLFLVADRCKVADFGLVKHLERSSSAGLMGGVSPYYAAPESFSGRISKHSDQYSLAIVYQELLTGTRPFKGKNIRQLALQHMSAPPELDILPECDRPIIARSLSKEPDERFPSCLSLIRSLMSVSPDGMPVVSMPSLPNFALPPLIAPLPLPKPAAPVKPIDDDEIGPNTTALPIEPIKPEASVPLPEEIVNLEVTQVPAKPIRPVDLIESSIDNANEILIAELPAPGAAASMAGISATLTAAEQTIGVLRPSIFIGVGSFGRRSMLELRCRLLDRVGELNEVPSYRFVYIDSDPEASRKAAHAPAAVLLGSEHLFPMQLQAVGNYRRKHLDALAEWLPQQKLYSIPRSLQPGDSRALGRLSFCDQYLRFIGRLKREIRVATHPEALAQSTSQTGLPLRDSAPRIYLFVDATSGLGGAMIDMVYAVRRILNEMNHPKAQIVLFLFCGAPSDPATPPIEQANVYASLAELHHFRDGSVRFQAQYGGHDGPRFTDEPFPLTASYLISLGHRTPESLRDSVGRLTTYVLQDLTTSLGPELENRRRERPNSDQTAFRSFGSYALWFPRGLLLREAARQMVQRLVEDWQASNRPQRDVPIQDVVNEALSDKQLHPDRIREQLFQMVARTPGGSPGEVLRTMLAEFESGLPEASQADASGWAKEAYQKISDYVGLRHSTEAESLYRRSRLTRVWNQAGTDLAEEWQKRLIERALQLATYPGSRLAAVEQAMSEMATAIGSWGTHLSKSTSTLHQRTNELANEFQEALNNCPSGNSGGFRLFGGRASRALRQFLEAARTLAEHRSQEELEQAVVFFYRRLKARLEERMSDMSFCRARLNHLAQSLAIAHLSHDNPIPVDGRSPVPGHSPNMIDPLKEALRGSRTLRVVLPRGEAEIERAAITFLGRLGPEHWRRLDNVLHQLVLTPMGGIFAVCHKSHDLMTHLGGPLIEQTAAFLGELLPVTDVAQVEFSASHAQRVKIEDELQDFYRAAIPLVAGSSGGQTTYLVVPQSEAGTALGEHARETLPDIHVISGVSQATDLMFCREQSYLNTIELESLLGWCRSSYLALNTNPVTSPHSRFDILQWIPLES